MTELNLDKGWELVQELQHLRNENKLLSQERDRWRGVAEDNNWPFEWEIATGIKQERDKLRHAVVFLCAALHEIKWNCEHNIVFDEDNEISEFPDDMRNIAEMALIGYPKDMGIDYASLELSEFRLSQDALMICETALKISIETFDDGAPGPGTSERQALRKMHEALECVQKRLYTLKAKP